MGFYQFKRQLEIKQPIKVLWKFISNPKNLKTITPDSMGFDITSKDLPDNMYEGMIISYKVSPFLGIKTLWVTEITKVVEENYFIDEQRVGPYKMWHHEHFLEPTKNGTLMTDLISYHPPFGFVGNIANSLFIRQKLNNIFDYRSKVLLELFDN